jgi:hypothetical protein
LREKQYETANRKVESVFENHRIIGFENKTPLYDSLFRIGFSRKSDRKVGWRPSAALYDRRLPCVLSNKIRAGAS